MEYKEFCIQNYKKISSKVTIPLDKMKIAPIIAKERVGKTSLSKALFAFDYRNDKFQQDQLCFLDYGLKKDFKSSKISAKVFIKDTDMEIFIEKIILENLNLFSNFLKKEKKISLINEKFRLKFIKQKKLQNFKITLSRNLFLDSKKNYYEILTLKDYNFQFELLTENQKQILDLNAFSTFCKNSFFQNLLAKKIVSHLPRILLFKSNSFFPSKIKLNSLSCETDAKWDVIFSHLFKNKVTKDKLSKIEKSLNHNLEKYYPFFTLEQNLSYKIKLELEKEIIHFFVIDKEKDIEFSLLDTGKRFYFTFILIMELCYYYEENLDKKLFFLFDEYELGLTAIMKAKWCEKISLLAKKHLLFYTSQNHQMFNLRYIQLKSILWLRDEENNNLSLNYLKQSKSDYKTTKDLMLQSIFDVLNLDNLDYFFAISKPILLVEGMSDKLYLEIFLDKKTLDKFFIVPSQGASALSRNIQYFIAFNKRFIVMSDLDYAGLKGLTNAKETYESYPYGVFLHWPQIISKKEIRVEDFLSKETFEQICSVIHQSKKTYKKSVIFTLARSGKANIQKVQNNVSKETKKHFKMLSEVLEKELLKIL